MEIQQGVVPDSDFIKAYSRFIDKNDRGGKKGIGPTEGKTEDGPAVQGGRRGDEGG